MIANIPDENLEKKLRKVLGQYTDPITVEELENIYGELDLHGKDGSITADDITDLTGLEHCINVTILNLNYHNFKNIDPLSGMIKLEKLISTWGSLENLNGLKNLPNIYSIEASHNKINDISALKGKTKIMSLYLDYNLIEDVAPLSGIPHLDYLKLSKNAITDLRPIKDIDINRVYFEGQNYEKDFGSADHKKPPEIIVYDVDGNSKTLDLGTPALGIADYSGSWTFPNKFDGTATIKNYGYTSKSKEDLNRPRFDLTNTNISVKEQEYKNDEELKSLFGITNISDNKDALTIDDVIVDQSNVDYEKAGDYKVIFSLEDSDTNQCIRNGIITVIFVPDLEAPVLEVKEEVRSEQFTSLTKEELFNLFDVKAYDNKDGDLTNKVEINYTNIDFDTPGYYDVYFSVQDNFGNITTKTSTLIITAKRGKIGAIKSINLIDIDTLEKHNIKCGDFKAIAGNINFSHTNSFKKVRTKNFIFSKNDDLLLDNTINFSAYFRESKDSIEFKRFLRRHDATFILEIEKNGIFYYTYVSKNNENLSAYNDASELENMKISLNQLSLWLRKKEISFALTGSSTEESNGYASNPKSTDDKEYHYPIIYKGTSETLDNFYVELPKFHGDFGVYLTVVLDDVDKEASYGFGGKWNGKDTLFAYRAADTFTVPKDESLVICPFPGEKGIWQQKSNQLLNFGTNREGDIVDVINGNQVLDPFVEIEPNQDKNYFIFTNVRKGRIYAIEQYANI